MSRTRISPAYAAGLLLVTLLVAAGQAATPERPAVPAIVRSGNHPGFGRLVIETDANVAYKLDQDGDHVIVRLGDDLAVATPPSAPRNVIAMKADGPALDLILNHGAQLHAMRMDGRIVLDIADNVVSPDKTRPVASVREPKPVPPPKTVSVAQPSVRSVNDTFARARIGTVPPKLPATVERPPNATQILPRVAAAAPMAGSVILEATSSGSAMPSSAVPNPGVANPGVANRAAPNPGVSHTKLPSSGTPNPATLNPETPHSEAPHPEAPGVRAPSIELSRFGMGEVAQQTGPGRDVMPENDGPVALRARRIKLPNGVDGSAFLVPFESTTAAASFRSGDSTYVVFDERRPVDMAALVGEPVFGAVSLRLLTHGTVFRIPHPATLSIALTQVPQGWRIAELAAEPRRQAIVASQADGHIDLAAEQPGGIVSMADPDTGATLLVGTQHHAGQAVAKSRRSTEFILRPTSQGVVVEPLSDVIALKQVPAGFSLSGGPAGLMLSPPTSMTAALMDASNLTRRLDFSTMAPDALLRRAIRQLGEAAAAAPLARGLRHRAAAESFMALGLAAEAESLLHMAAEQDPREAASPTNQALSAIAALLAGRTGEADALLDPKLDGTDEIALWRAVRQAMLVEGSPAAAAAFAATAPLVFQYPKPIREHILPLLVETMIQGGELVPAARLLDQGKDDPHLAYARALKRQAEGDTGEALKLLDGISAGHDQFDRARAAIRAVELRLATHEIDKTQAADALDKLLYAWRGDSRELALRQRVADLRGQTGAWRVALSTLRQAETDFPEQAAALRARLKFSFSDMIRDQGARPIPPIEFVAMVGENTDLVPDSADDEAVEQALAERLIALDLPARAKPVLEKLLRQAKSDAAKGRFGLGLATLESQQGNDAGAIAALNASQGQDLAADLVEQRLVLRAVSVARQGDPPAAVAMLALSQAAPATLARAQIQEGALNWAGAASAWSDRAALTVPAAGNLEDVQIRTVLRLATATARAGDDTGLAALREKYDRRIGAGPLAGMFRLLTAEPVRGTADIKRSQQELSLAASLPASLRALQTSSVIR